MAKTNTSAKAPKTSTVKNTVEKIKALFDEQDQASHVYNVEGLSKADRKSLSAELFREGYEMLEENNGINIQVEKILN